MFRKKKRILLVDDEVEILRYLSKTLKSWKYEVSECQCFGEAVSELRRHRFDLVITDISMPQESGYDLISVIESSDLELPIILMSGAVNIYDDSHCPKPVYQRIHSYLEKPFTAEELRAQVESAIHEKKMAS